MNHLVDYPIRRVQVQKSTAVSFLSVGTNRYPSDARKIPYICPFYSQNSNRRKTESPNAECHTEAVFSEDCLSLHHFHRRDWEGLRY
jgi:hypothetical protein